jgi:hypothetical protein
MADLTGSPSTNAPIYTSSPTANSEAESKEKHGAGAPVPELTITSPHFRSRVDSNTFTMGNPMPESTLTQWQSRLYPPPVRDFGFGLWLKTQLETQL